MEALKRLIEKRTERIAVVEKIGSSSEVEFILPERVNFYFATLRILHQLRKKTPEPVKGMQIQEIISLICALDQATSVYGALVTSPKSDIENYEEKVENNMRIIINSINTLGFRDVFQKEVQYSNKENLDLHKAQRIIPGVFLGGSAVASDLKKLKNLGITHIVCCLQGACKFKNEFLYLNIPIYDTPFEDISKYFSSSYDFIHNALCNSTVEKPNNVYIHCAAGISRAPTICTAFLMRELGISSIQALNLIKLSRPYVAPNPGFLNQLYNYQLFLTSAKIFRKKQQISSSNQTQIYAQQGIPCQTHLKRNVGRIK
ncbi:dual specificity phosphatase [Cryptosporidium ubiquitum]|uniref:Dual specificity phosphatase n=1 Tax=Cryptosporidium ubiquitum TaxID=857276 RepID=A0A1J4M9B9_9CRYT|nr:dual specificity phosphatase [Cryptosporidium ubiquitum]OII70810.1 dual specificity phosphatase [Cryptosporidium ubiquitum]